jgi:hypothetical protein
MLGPVWSSEHAVVAGHCRASSRAASLLEHARLRGRVALRVRALFFLSLALAIAGCNGGSASAPSVAALPAPNNATAVPAGVVAAAGYRISVFAVMPSTSTNPDSIVQIGSNVFIGVGDDLGPDGTPGPSGKKNVEILEYSLGGVLEKTFSVVGHNDGLMAFDSNTLWAMSNEDCNPKLTVINLATGAQQVYTPQASLVTAGCLTNTNGGIDDMQLIGGTVYVSASNPNPTPPGPCPANSSTPGCPNGVSTANAVYALKLNADGATFNLTPIFASGSTAKNVVTGADGSLNMTDPDSESLTPDGSTLVVDSQQDSELVFIKNPGTLQSVTYLPLTLGGALTAVDDTRYVVRNKTLMLFTDTPKNYVYRVDGAFNPGSAFTSGPVQVANLNLNTGVLTPIVSGLGAPHGMIFAAAP